MVRESLITMSAKMKIVKVKGLFKGTYSLLPQMKAQFAERNFFIFLDFFVEFRIDAMLVTDIGYKPTIGDTNYMSLFENFLEKH